MMNILNIILIVVRLAIAIRLGLGIYIDHYGMNYSIRFSYPA